MNPQSQFAIALRTPFRSGGGLCAQGSRLAWVLGLFLATTLLSANDSNRPEWVNSPTADYQPGEVLAIEELSEADLVIVAGGYETGFRSGVVSTVQRNGVAIAEVLIVEVRPRIMAAAIREMAEETSIQPGDIVRPRVTRF